MKVVLSARVEADIVNQLSYDISAYGKKTAERTFARVDIFLNRFLISYPRAGWKLAQCDLYETWIARTPFVVIYCVDDEAEIVTVLALFHHARDRSDFEPDKT
ncbi:MAG: type II toxin-antitoxin system RelE/ParE family toxin [Parvularculaceae bacterium]